MLWFKNKLGKVFIFVKKTGKWIIFASVAAVTIAGFSLLSVDEILHPVVEVNGQVIEFPYTDDNTGENLIIWTDKEVYAGWIGEEISLYYYIENNSNRGGVFNSQIYLEDVTLKATYLLVEDVSKVRQVPVYENVCEFVSYEATSSTQARVVEECSDVEIGFADEDYEEDEWILLTKQPKKNFVNLNKKPTGGLVALNRVVFQMIKDGYVVLRRVITIDKAGITREFFDEVSSASDNSAYGHLDPTVSSAWAGFDTLNTSTTLVVTNENDIVLLDNCVNDSSDFQTNVQPDGDDLRYTTSTDTDSEILNYDLVNYADGDCEVYVILPSVSSSTSDTIYKWAGNAGASSAASSGAVWAGYENVYHFQSDAFLTDSTVNGNTLTNNGGATSTDALYGTALDVGTAGGKYMSVSSVFAGTSSTIQAWLNVQSVPSAAFFTVLQLANPTVDVSHELFYRESSGLTTIWSRDKPCVASQRITTTNDLGTDNWNKMFLSYDATTLRGYLNSPPEEGSLGTSGNGTCAADGLFIGASTGGGDEFEGFVDEVRIKLGVADSSGRLQTIFGNQNSSSTFWDNTGWTALAGRRVIFIQ